MSTNDTTRGTTIELPQDSLDKFSQRFEEVFRSRMSKCDDPAQRNEKGLPIGRNHKCLDAALHRKFWPALAQITYGNFDPALTLLREEAGRAPFGDALNLMTEMEMAQLS